MKAVMRNMNIRKVVNRSSLYSIAYVFIGLCLGFIAISVGLTSAESEIYIWSGTAIFMFVFIAWIIWALQPEKVFCSDRTLTRKHKGKLESIEIRELVEIKYHYHAVVGFISTWEFINRNGGSLIIDGEAKNISEVLSQLERILPGFSLANLKVMFESADVEDVLDVWKIA